MISRSAKSELGNRRHGIEPQDYLLHVSRYGANDDNLMSTAS